MWLSAEQRPQKVPQCLSRRTTYSSKRSACQGGRQHGQQRGVAGLVEPAGAGRVPGSDGWLLPCSRASGVAEPWPHSRQSYSSSISKNKMQMQNETLVRATGRQQERCSCQAGAVQQKGRGACLCAALGQLGPFPF